MIHASTETYYIPLKKKIKIRKDCTKQFAYVNFALCEYLERSKPGSRMERKKHDRGLLTERNMAIKTRKNTIKRSIVDKVDKFLVSSKL